MLGDLHLQNLLIIDIETVPGMPGLDELNPEMQELWALKEGHRCPEGVEPQDHYFGRAGIFSEFGKIVCISAGLFTQGTEGQSWNFRIKSFYDKDECTLLQQFSGLLNDHYNDPRKHIICGHNIKEFDIPYICRRMLVNDCVLPDILDIAGKKPWEVNFLDTLQLWKFGDYKNYTSLRLLAALFNIPTPKDDIDGSQVGHVYWKDDDLKRIMTYCQKDVLTCAQLILKFKGQPMLKEDEVTFLKN